MTTRLKFGTANQVRDDCLALLEAGVDQLILRFAVPEDMDVDLERHCIAPPVLPYC